MVQPLKFKGGKIISSHTLLSMWLIMHAGMKLIHFSKKNPQAS